MGNGQSLPTAEAELPTVPLTGKNSKAVLESVKVGNQIYLEKDVRDKIQSLTKVFEKYSENDHKGLLKEVDSINNTLKRMGHPSLELSDKVKNALMQFHGAILSGIDTSNMDQEQKDRKFIELINDPKGDPKKNMDNIFKLLGDYYGKDFEKARDEIVNSPGIADSKEMKDNISLIINNVKGLKVKYKFFEYKYIELNIFLILFIQHVYRTLDEFIKNVLAFNSQRDDTREKVLKDTLKVMINILTAADLQIEPQDFEYLTGMMDKIKSDMQDKEREMNNKLKDLVTITTDNLSGFLDAMTDATKVDMYQKLGATEAVRNPQPKPGQYTGGMLRGESILPRSFYEQGANGASASTQSGGFIRGHSVMPQAFYNLDGVGVASTPDTDAGASSQAS